MNLNLNKLTTLSSSLVLNNTNDLNTAQVQAVLTSNVLTIGSVSYQPITDQSVYNNVSKLTYAELCNISNISDVKNYIADVNLSVNGKQLLATALTLALDPNKTLTKNLDTNYLNLLSNVCQAAIDSKDEVEFNTKTKGINKTVAIIVFVFKLDNVPVYTVRVYDTDLKGIFAKNKNMTQYEAYHLQPNTVKTPLQLLGKPLVPWLNSFVLNKDSVLNANISDRNSEYSSFTLSCDDVSTTVYLEPDVNNQLFKYAVSYTTTTKLNEYNSNRANANFKDVLSTLEFYLPLGAYDKETNSFVAETIYRSLNEEFNEVINNNEVKDKLKSMIVVKEPKQLTTQTNAMNNKQPINVFQKSKITLKFGA